MHARTHHTGNNLRNHSTVICNNRSATWNHRDEGIMRTFCISTKPQPYPQAPNKQPPLRTRRAPSHFAASPAAIFTKPLLPQPFNLIYQSPDLLISSSKSTTDLLAHCPSYSPTVDGRTKQENHIDIWGEGGCSMYKGLNNSSIYGSVSVVFILSHATDLLSYWSPNLLLHKSASIW